MTIEKRVERLEQAAEAANPQLRHIVLRYNHQTEAEALDGHGRDRLIPGRPVHFIHLVGVEPAPSQE